MNYKWGIFFPNLNPVIDSKQPCNHPVLVMSDETFNSNMPVVTILSIVDKRSGRKSYPNEVELKANSGGLPRDAIIQAHQLRTISKERLSSPVGYVEDSTLRAAINEALKVHLNLI
ncbi:MAG: transcriptional modulator of MazE/toxin MazF [Promethearchaeota archaeon CR_4]|nr:MAG: transcriptional modulator of MazE/toxin MazF [Candidatus Lokiarchaeota archaeon CR_4]